MFGISIGCRRKKRKATPKGKAKKLVRMTVPERHQYRIARDTLKMPQPMVGVMGGMSKSQAKQVIANLRKAGKIR